MPPKLHGPAGAAQATTTTTEDFASTSLFIESELHKKLSAIGDRLAGDMITVVAPMAQGIDDFVRDAIEDIKPRSQKLVRTTFWI